METNKNSNFSDKGYEGLNAILGWIQCLSYYRIDYVNTYHKFSRECIILKQHTRSFDNETKTVRN